MRSRASRATGAGAGAASRSIFTNWRLRCDQKLAQTRPQGLQFLGGVADPEGERGTVDGDTVGRQHLRLTIERQMPMILGVNYMRDETLGGQSPLINRSGAACWRTTP